MRYRAEIDGLRAVAVVPIVLFHAGVVAISGGFIGVDIFFVISGYLITSIIVRDMDLGRFSILEFYRRRILRIFPALFVMLVIVLIVGALTMLPEEVRGLGKSAAAAAGFISNIFFYKDADYFAGAAEFKPLLHTWSLGVEEQFYVFFPLYVLLVRKIPRLPLQVSLLVPVVLSFLVGAFLVRVNLPAAFYLLPSRAWELGIGSLVALGATPKLSTPLKAMASYLGVGLIVIGYAVASPGAMFPVPLALLPCIGAALVIAYSQGTLVGKALSTGLFTGIGAISYSLYLWHWPVIAFYRLNYGQHIPLAATALLVAASFALAMLSRRFVELPFMLGFKSDSSRSVVLAGVVGLVVMVAAGLGVAWNANGWRQLPPDVRQIASFSDYRSRPEYGYQFRRGSCFPGDGDTYDRQACLKIDDTKSNIVVLGDSHAAQYWRAISEHFSGANVLQATASGCRPTLPARGADRCVDVVNYVLGPLINTGKIDTLIVAGRWTTDDVAAIGPTIDAIRPKVRRLVLIGPTVEYDGEFPQLLARALLGGHPDSVASQRLKEQFDIDKAMAKAAGDKGIDYISALAIECPDQKCVLSVDGSPMQFDYGHLSLEGARYVVGRMAF